MLWTSFLYVCIYRRPDGCAFWKDYCKPPMWIAVSPLAHIATLPTHTLCSLPWWRGSALCMGGYSQRQICETVYTGGGVRLQEGIILFAYLRASAWPSTTWVGCCLGTELNVLISSKWPTFHRLTTSPSLTFLYDRNSSFPNYIVAQERNLYLKSSQWC